MKSIKTYISIIAVALLLFTSCKNNDKIITSFGYMNDKLEESTDLTEVKNEVYRDLLARKVQEDSIKYYPIYERLINAQKASNEFFAYLEAVKDSIYDGTLDEDEARTSYNELTNSDFLDHYFFDGKSLTPQGKEFLKKINEYKRNFSKALGKGYGTVASMVTSRFRTKELMDYSGNIIPWLNFKFEKFPAMASIFNITQMQYDVRQIETELIEAMNSGEFEKEFAMRHYTGIVKLDKGSYYPDERITGRIVMGRFDDSVKPFDIVLDGKKLSNTFSTEGAVLLDFKAPAPGEYPLKGSFSVMYDGTPVRINFKSAYKVVSRENVVEKVVYKTEYVEKPVYIEKTVYKEKPASKPKVTKKPVIAPDAKTRKYYATGEKSTDIEGTVNGEKGHVTMLKTTLRQAKIGAIRTKDNQSFDVTSFKIKVPGQLTVYVEGNTFSEEAIRTIDKAKSGQRITIFDIKAVDKSGNRMGRVKVVNISLKK